MRRADIAAISVAMHAVLARDAWPIVMDDGRRAQLSRVSPCMAAAPDGLLPSVLQAGSAIWHLATGHPYRVRVVSDDGALLGERVESVSGVSFMGAYLSSLAALDEVRGAEGIAANHLPRLAVRVRAEAEAFWRPKGTAPAATPSSPARSSSAPTPGAG